MVYMFCDARNFNPCHTSGIDLFGINRWDISGVGRIQYMFSGVINFNQKLDWNISRVADVNHKTEPCLLFPEIFDEQVIYL